MLTFTPRQSRRFMIASANTILLLLCLWELQASTLGAYGEEPSGTERAALMEKTISGTVESISVFKNGFAVVSERFEFASSGRFVAEAPKYATHGAFFVESNVAIKTSADLGKIEVPLSEADALDWTTDFQNCWLNVVLADGSEMQSVRPIRSDADAKSDAISVASAPFEFSRSGATFNAARSVLLETQDGKTIWLPNSSTVKLVSFTDAAPKTVFRTKGRLVFDVAEIPQGTIGAARVLYLTRGLAWAPQYRVDLKDASELEIEQSAVLLNDWRDLNEVPTALCSGFPQIAMQGVDSPMSSIETLTNFLRRLSVGGRNAADGAIMTQAVVSNARVSVDDVNFNEIASTFGDGVDVFAQSIGVASLGKGSRALISIARKKTPYKRLVYWSIADARNVDAQSRAKPTAPGLTPGSYGLTTSGSPLRDYSEFFSEPWEVVEFKNPFDFPITTGPATALDGARFLGQNALGWTAPGENAFLPITKALSVRVRSTETERETEARDGAAPMQNVTPLRPSTDYFNEEYWGRLLNVAGVICRLVAIDAKIEMTNLRNETVEVRACRRFSGRQIENSFSGFDASLNVVKLASPQRRQLNPQYELNWSTTLQPGETKTATFSYWTLIPN